MATQIQFVGGPWHNQTRDFEAYEGTLERAIVEVVEVDFWGRPQTAVYVYLPVPGNPPRAYLHSKQVLALGDKKQ